MTPEPSPPSDLPEELEKPKAVVWFKIHALVLAGLYFLVAGFGVTILTIGQSHMAMKAEERWIMGGIYTVMGVLPMALYGIILFLPRKKWVWIYSIVLIALTMTNCCCMPMAIPLLIQYVKPEVKRYYCGDEEQVS